MEERREFAGRTDCPPSLPVRLPSSFLSSWAAFVPPGLRLLSGSGVKSSSLLAATTAAPSAVGGASRRFQFGEGEGDLLVFVLCCCYLQTCGYMAEGGGRGAHVCWPFNICGWWSVGGAQGVSSIGEHTFPPDLVNLWDPPPVLSLYSVQVRLRR